MSSGVLEKWWRWAPNVKLSVLKLSLLVSALSALNATVISALVGDTGYLVVSVGIAFLAGFLAVFSSHLGLFFAALMGALVFAVAHVLIGGGTFLVLHYVNPSRLDGQGLMAFGRVLVSFVMFAPLAAFVAWLGGLYGQWAISWEKNNA